MALFRGTIRSQALEMDTAVHVILPYDRLSADGEQMQYDKVLYLLHGLKQNADAWQRMSSVERYAQEHGFVVVMPEVQRSFYTDMAHGLKYFTYISEELPCMMQRMFHLPKGPERTFAGGLSMGGYGALKCALLRPDVFGGAMCFSSGFYILDNAEQFAGTFHDGEMAGIVGEKMECSDSDRLEMGMEAYPQDRPRPLLYLACGTEDPLHPLNVRMRGALEKRGFAPAYEEWSGAHNWKFWDAAVQRGMEYIARQSAMRNSGNNAV